VNTTVAALLGSVIGAVAALGGAIATSVVTLRNERQRQESTKQSAYVSALRERSGAVFAQFFKIVQEIEWITWYGINDPGVIDEQRIKSYDEAVNSAYGTLLGAMAMTASLSLTAYQEMRPILSKLYDLEGRVALAIRQIGSDHSTAVKDLRACKSDAATLRNELPPQLNQIMALAEAAGDYRDRTT
jgi:hypothetical protein